MAGSGSCRRLSRRARSAGEAPAGGAVSPLVKRRSERKMVSPAQSLTETKARSTATKTLGSPRPVPFVMQPITLKKIAPRARQIKEMASTPRRSPRLSLKEGKENVGPEAAQRESPVGRDAKRESEPRSSRSCALNPESGTPSGGKGVLSPITGNTSDSPPEDERDLTMAKRVRRSYSRLEVSFTRSFLDRPSSPPPRFGLSDTSTPNHGPEKRQTLFGFEKLLAPGSEADASRPNPDATQKLMGAERGTPPEPDLNIPGISFIRERRKKKKIPQFNELELDEWVSQMNAEFEEAEKFDLLVE
ncbi:sororin isoform X1 [Pogona vitticeps]